MMEDASLTPRPGMLEATGFGAKLPLAFLFGSILGLSSAGFDQSWIAWIGVAPLLVILRTVNGMKEAAFVGLAFGLGYHLVATSWFLGLFPLRWLGVEDWLGVQLTVLVWIFESLHEALLIGGFAFLVFCLPLRSGFLPHYKRPFFPYMWAVPLIWIYCHWVVGTSELFLAVPVDQLAYSQSQHTGFIQIARIGGSALVDFILILFNAALAELILDLVHLGRRLDGRMDKLRQRVGPLFDVAVVSLVIVICNVWGGAEVKRIARETRPEVAILENPQTQAVPIAVVQGNISIEEDRLKTTSAKAISDRYAELSNSLGTSLMVLPEGVVNPVQLAPGYLVSRLKEISLREKKEIVVGSVESIKNAHVNAARLISPVNPPNNLYVKRRLVPIGELAPLKAIEDTLPADIKKRLPSEQMKFLTSKSTELLQCLWGPMGVSICSEIVYPRLISREVRKGATILLNLSNLAWFHNSALNKQVLAAAVFRAVENGRYLVLSTNTGISAVIDPAGMVTAVSYPGKRGVLIGTVQFLYKKTPFSKMWWL
jgi:apolipoprotein N-acyltransferase